MSAAWAATLRQGEWRALLIFASKLIAAQPRLDGEEIEADACQDDEEHHGGDCRPHIRIADLQLETEKGAVKERAQNVRREIRARKCALARIDQVEGVEVADE